MIVIVILGIISAIAIPNYTKTIIAAQRKDAINNLKMIHAANQLYYSRNNKYFPAAAATLDDINQALSLGIIPGDLTYTCTGDGAAFSCSANRTTAPTFTVTVTQSMLSATNPSCSGSCS